jgi:hypothetical protein
MKLFMWLLVVAGAMSAQSRNEAIRTALDEWSKNTKVEITAGARQRITSQALEPPPRLQQFLDRQKEAATAFNRTVRAYCFELRDTAGKGAKVIEEKTVEKLSFAAFLERAILPFFNRPAGYLQVKSQPGEGDIRLDNRQRGFADKAFVLEEGSHEVRVTWRGAETSCWQRVYISSGKTEVVECRKD